MKTFTEYTNLDEGVNDPAIFKAVFMAGGPGSGKSFIANQTGMKSMGLRLINSDDIFEHELKKAGMKMDAKTIFSTKGQMLRGHAKKLTGKKKGMSLDGRLGLLIDGTGKDVDKIKKQQASLTELGYDTMMIFVNTTEITSLRRNKMRARSLDDDKVSSMWTDVQKNIGAFQKMFGNNFVVVDNSEGIDYKKETLSAYKFTTKWVKRPIKNHIAKKWIAAQKEARGITA